MFNYIGFRVFEYFNQKDETTAVSKTIYFLALLQGSIIVPLFMLINLFIKIDPQVFGVNDRIKYYIGIPLAILLYSLNRFLVKKNLSGDSFRRLHKKYHKESYSISIWVIFLAPIFFVFICPIIYGTINGTIHFPFLEK